jgi:hypothetical protein
LPAFAAVAFNFASKQLFRVPEIILASRFFHQRLRLTGKRVLLRAYPMKLVVKPLKLELSSIQF